MRGGLTKADWVLGAIYRLAIRRCLPQEVVERLMHSKASLSENAARRLAGHWFSQQYRHGLHWQQGQYRVSKGMIE